MLLRWLRAAASFVLVACHGAPPVLTESRMPSSVASSPGPAASVSAPSSSAASSESAATLAPIARFPGRAWAALVDGRVVLYDLWTVRVLSRDLRAVERTFKPAALFGTKTAQVFADGGMLIAAAGTGNRLSVGRIDPLAGKFVWRLELDGQPGNRETVNLQRVYAAGDKLILALGRAIGVQEPELVGVGAREGRLLFREPWQPSPDVALVAGELLIEDFANRIHARSATNGRITWEKDANPHLYRLLTADARYVAYSVRGTRATMDTLELVELSTQRVTASGAPSLTGPAALSGNDLLINAPDGLVAYDTRTLRERLRVPSREGFRASRPAVGRGVIYACLADATLVAVERTTGTTLVRYGLGLTGPRYVIDDTGPLVVQSEAFGEAIVVQSASPGGTPRETVVFAPTGVALPPPERTVISGVVRWSSPPSQPIELDIDGFRVKADEQGRFAQAVEGRGVIAVRVLGTEEETFTIVPLTGRGSAGYFVSIDATPESFSE